MGGSRIVGVVLAGALLVGGCGDGGGGAGADTGEAAAAEGTKMPDGDVYVGELEDGSMLRVALDVSPDEPSVAPFEAFRRTVGGPEVTWIVADVEVPEGVDGTGRFVTFVAEGAEMAGADPSGGGDGVASAEFACSLLDAWSSATPDQDAAADAYLELYQGPCGGETLQVVAPSGETTRYVMVYEGELPEFERVFAGAGTELHPA